MSDAVAAPTDTPMVTVRCRICQYTVEIFRSNENHWYETHKCAEATP